MVKSKRGLNTPPTKQELNEWAKGVVKSPTGKTNSDTNASQPDKIPQKKSVFLLVILSIITVGIYPAIWYIKRAPELNDLHTQKQISKGLAIGYLVIMILAIISTIISQPMLNLNLPTEVMYASAGLALISLIFAITLAFKTK